MVNDKVASRYAKALLNIAKEFDSTKIVLDELENISGLLNTSKDFYLLTQSPVIRPSKKLAIFNEILKDKVSDLTFKFMELLIKKGREAHIKAIIISYKEQYNELNNLLEVQISTAKELSQLLKEAIVGKVNQLTGKTILPEFKQDAAIIGGVQIKFADFFFDASIKKQLSDLFDEIAN